MVIISTFIIGLGHFRVKMWECVTLLLNKLWDTFAKRRILWLLLFLMTSNSRSLSRELTFFFFLFFYNSPLFYLTDGGKVTRFTQISAGRARTQPCQAPPRIVPENVFPALWLQNVWFCVFSRISIKSSIWQDEVFCTLTPWFPASTASSPGKRGMMVEEEGGGWGGRRGERKAFLLASLLMCNSCTLVGRINAL